MTQDAARSINDRLGSAIGHVWQGQFGFGGAAAPGHQIVAQIEAVLGNGGDDIVHVEFQSNERRVASQLEMTLLVFTSDFVLHIKVDAGKRPTTRVVPRATLSDLRVTSAVVDFPSDRQFATTSLEVALTYPAIGEVTLPFNDHDDRGAKTLASLLESLPTDLLRGTGAEL